MEKARIKKGRAGLVLLALGAVLCAYAAYGILQTPALCQYAVLSPDAENLQSIRDTWNAQKESLNGVYGASVYAASYAAQISTGENAAAALFGVNEGFSDAHPKIITEGRWFDAAEMSAGIKLTVLSEKLAFALFPGGEALGKNVSIADAEYRVIGVAKDALTPGDTDDMAAYAPMKSLSVSFALLIADCVATSASDARALEEAARAALGEGGETFYLQKEVMRAWMLVRFIIVAFGLIAAASVFKATNSRFAKAFLDRREELKTRYARDMIPELIKQALRFAACYLTLALAAAGLLSLLIKPMYVFTEWIPDVFVEWSSIRARLSALVKHFSRPIKLQTREMAALSFYALMLRWGVTAVLAGVIARTARALTNPETEGIDN